MMKKYGTVAGIPKEKQQFHALKHSIGTHILDAGEDVYFAKDWLERFGEDTLETPFKIATTNDGFLLAITSYLLQKGRPVKVLTEIH